MKNFVKKLSAIVLSTVFASTQVFASTVFTGDIGLGEGNGGASINSATGGYLGTETDGTTATLYFDGDSHVNWDTLNVNGDETLNFNGWPVRRLHPRQRGRGHDRRCRFRRPDPG